MKFSRRDLIPSPLCFPVIVAAVMISGTSIACGHLYMGSPSNPNFRKAAQAVVDRNPQQMCEEVAYELNIQVEEGMLSRETAKRVTDRCFRIFVNTK